MDIVVTDDPESGRFVARVGDDVAGVVEYRMGNERIAFTHTEVDPEFQGQGVGSVLARDVLGAARDQGLGVLPLCPYIRGFIEKHPDYLDLVPVDERSRFDLAK